MDAPFLLLSLKLSEFLCLNAESDPQSELQYHPCLHHANGQLNRRLREQNKYNPRLPCELPYTSQKSEHYCQEGEYVEQQHRFSLILLIEDQDEPYVDYAESEECDVEEY